ncbi:MAG: PEP/pyruvate-binding domain-containing protein [Desulfobulbaceae bacterium]|jgi:pyruvate,water dikinase|nr:PEP/pyruvate-binding domain-containing protein [Desulfobulbaceae bacterium]
MLGILNRIVLQFISPKAVVRAKYNAFKELLHHDRLSHRRLAELEELYYRNHKVDLNLIRRRHGELATGVLAMIGCLNRMAPASYLTLRAYARKIEFYGRIALTPLTAPVISAFILPLDTSYADDGQTGGKGLHLSILKHELDLPVPEGFIVSTSAFHNFMEENNLRPLINDLLSRVDIDSEESLSQAAGQLMGLINGAELPYRLARDMQNSVADLGQRTGAEFFAVRSSAVGEDSEISFAGQYESVLEVGAGEVLAAYKKVLASKYSPRAIYYRIKSGFLDEETPMAVLVLRMIDAGLSGVVTTRGSAGGAEEKVIIHYIEGLGDKLVSGQCSPATVVVNPEKDEVIVERSAAAGGSACDGAGAEAVEPAGGRKHFPADLSRGQAVLLAAWARRIEGFFQAPQEIEWSLDRWGDVFLLQTRPMRIQETIEEEQDDLSGIPVLLTGGETASRGAACGPVHIIEHEGQLAAVADGSVLVTSVIPPSYVVALDRVCAVVAEQGSAAGHFASVAREAGVPVLVKTGNASAVLPAGRVVTVCADLGMVFDGCAERIVKRYPTRRIEQRDTPVRRAFSQASPFIFPLQLIDPADSSFAPENCRSLHDIIRFVHEKGVQAMFSHTSSMFAKRSATTLLKAPIPLQIYLLDLDDDIAGPRANGAEPPDSAPRSFPLQALLRGLTHPGIRWRHHDHFDWKGFSEATMAGGIVSSSDPAYASYAVVSADYLNLNLRFGYHFVILDSLCGAVAENNYIKLRFAGGGGDPAGITLRLQFVTEILQRLGFSVQRSGDLLDAQLMRYNQKDVQRKLDVVGRLLAATTLMDMVIRDEGMVGRMVEAFMNGRYDFSD